MGLRYLLPKNVYFATSEDGVYKKLPLWQELRTHDQLFMVALLYALKNKN